MAIYDIEQVNQLCVENLMNYETLMKNYQTILNTPFVRHISHRTSNQNYQLVQKINIALNFRQSSMFTFYGVNKIKKKLCINYRLTKIKNVQHVPN